MKKFTLGIVLSAILLLTGTLQAQISTFPYTESFEAGPAGWATDGGANDSWALGTPAKPVIIGASDGTQAWVTNLTGLYPANHQAAIVSPVFDFSTASGQPNITLDVWWESEFSWDGAVLQTSTNGGGTWADVGAFGDPNNWYTDGTINGLPGNEDGWTGRNGTGPTGGSNGWRTAVHPLNGMLGQPSVILRVLFGSDSSVNDDGFAFDNVRITLGDPPVIACPPSTTADTDPGQCSAVVNFTPAVAIDPEDGPVAVTQTMGPASGSAFPTGVTIVEFSATDSDGNVSFCQFTVTVTDNEDPVAVCQDITVELDPVTGTASITAADIDNGSSDNCGIVSSTVSPNMFTCSNVGDNTVTLTVTDAQGNSTMCTAIVTVEDNTAPVIVCQGEPGIVSVTEDFEAATIPAGWSTVIVNGLQDWTFGSGAMPGTTDFPTNAAIFDDDAAGGTGDNHVAHLLSPIYDLSASVTADLSFDYALGDFAGSGLLRAEVWDGAAWQQVFLADGMDIPPSPSGVIDVSAFANADFQVRFTYDDENSGWNWGAGVDNFQLDYELATSPPFDVVLDASGNATIDASMLLTSVTEACSYIVTVGGPASAMNVTECGNAPEGIPAGAPGTTSGPMNPSIATVTDTGVIGTDYTFGNIEMNIQHTWASDIDMTLTSPSGTIINVMMDRGGSSGLDVAATLVFTDASTNDVTMWSSGVPAADYQAEGGLFNTVFAGEPIDGDWTLNITDDAGGDSGTLNSYCITFAPIVDTTVSFDCSQLGENQVEVFVTDNSGNSTSCIATVNVIDATAPVITCVGPTVPVITDTVSDTPALAIPDNDPVGASTTITVADDFVITDLNVAMDITHTWVGDLIITLESPAGTTAVLVDRMGTTTGGVGCSSNDLEITLDDEATLPIEDECQAGPPAASGDFTPNNPLSIFDGESTVGDWILTITDNAGGDTGTLNSWGLTYSYDGTPTLAFPILLGADGTATIDPLDLLATVDEACGISTAAADITMFDCSDIGSIIDVTVFVSDASGNIASCVAQVEVFDQLAPEITCPADQTVDPGADNLFYTVPDYFATGEATATDNCTDPVTITTQDPAAGTQLADGVYTVTLTAEDEYGNVATCTFELTVETVLGVNDTSLDNAIVMYPNPARDILTISN
ncbi:proprotein convertase P-domain-containing protein, partial [Altibacter lentus]|uniref:proprotein convertase P-domain-containing protein n=1 Tax=Altibacter lentus TaxID=1223410 RepID=UPI00191C036B